MGKSPFWIPNHYASFKFHGKVLLFAANGFEIFPYNSIENILILSGFFGNMLYWVIILFYYILDTCIASRDDKKCQKRYYDFKIIKSRLPVKS